MLYPLRFKPIFKPRIWGGRRLAELYGKSLPPGVDIGESWELSGLPGDESVVADGPLAGATLGDLVRRFGRDLLGTTSPVDGQFPLLVKLLDARRNLSVQVHPSAEMVRRRGGACRLKHECWFVIDAEPGACLWLGLNDGVTRERFAAAVSDGSVASLLRCRPVRAGEFYDLPAGTVHALGGGIVVAEVQTPSDTTYRVFDWNRIDAATGKPRALNVAEALEAMDFSPRAQGAAVVEDRRDAGGPADGAQRLLACDSFIVDRRRVQRGSELAIGGDGRMVVWQLLGGQVSAGGRQFGGGELMLFPAGMKKSPLTFSADSDLLEVTVP